MKFREKCYETIEKEPGRTEEIKIQMMLHNFYSLRMLVDIGFKQLMLQELGKALQQRLTVETFKKLISWLIEEFSAKPGQLFDILSDKPEPKKELNLDPIKDYRERFDRLTHIAFPEPSMDSERRNNAFLKIIFQTADKNTPLYNALEDLLVEFDKGIFNSRYFRPGEFRLYSLFRLHPYIKLVVNQPLKNVKPFPQNLYLSYLIPEYYTNQINIAELFYDALKSQVKIPDTVGPSFIGHQAIHLMSVLMALLFEEYPTEKKLTLLNQIHPFSVSSNSIETIGLNFERFRDLTLPISSLTNSSKEEFTNRSFLHWLARVLFEQELHVFSIKIYEYLARNEPDPVRHANFTDNIATGKRDLGQYAEAIQIYTHLRPFYQKQNLYYSDFLASKNIAYSYHELGQDNEANRIFDTLEKDVTKFKGEELGGVYFNLAIRYRKMHQYKKEEQSLELALKNLPLYNPYHDSVQDRIINLTDFIDPRTGTYDVNKLKLWDDRIYFEKNLDQAIAYQKLLNLSVFEYYLNRAYAERDKDIAYWVLMSIEYVLNGDWNRLLVTSNAILKRDPEEITGHFYMALYYLDKMALDETLSHLLSIFSKGGNQIKFGTEFDEKITNFLFFLCHKTSELQNIEKIFEYWFSKSNLKDDNVLKLILTFAQIFVQNNEQQVSKFIFWKYLTLNRCGTSLYLCGEWDFRFGNYKEAKECYKESSKIDPKDIRLLQKLARTNLFLNEFQECDQNLQQILSITSDPLIRVKTEDFQKYARLIRDTKIRCENISIAEVKIVFNTVCSQLKLIIDVNEIEFGDILTEISKGYEILMGKTVGPKITKMIQTKYPTIPKKYQFGKKPDILPIDRIFLKFLKNPQDHNPGLGNWNAILNGILKKTDPKNPVMTEIYQFLSDTSLFDQEMLQKALDITNILLDDRNWGTHSKLYSREEVEKILTQLTPPINDLIEYLPKI